MHAQLAEQVAIASQSGELDPQVLLSLIDQAYQGFELDRRTTEHSNQMMAEEIEEQNLDLRVSLAEIQVQNLRFQAALDNMPQGLCLFDEAGKLVVANLKFNDLYRLPANADLRGMTLAEVLASSPVFSGFDRLEKRMLIEEHVCLASRTLEARLEQTWSDGRAISITRNPVDDGGYLDMVADVTEIRKASARISHLANFDSLTDLPNRLQFREHLLETVAGCARGPRAAVLCIDLDRFKAVNDTLGHPIGDALLVEVANRLRSVLRATEKPARLGGDEFAVIARNVVDDAQVHQMAARIIETISQPYIISGHQVQIGASIGIEYITSARVSPDEILRNADLALNLAKTEGRGCYKFYASTLHDAVSRRRLLEIEIREALRLNQFVIHYQPQYCLRKKIISGFEALVRWNSPTRGILLPGEFIGLCEETGLIDLLGARVLSQACHDAKAFPKALTIAVNLSPIQFKSKGLVEMVSRILDETGLEPSRLELEVTEGVMISDPAATLEILNDLRRLGIRISLDDFGTGYSSLSYIRKFPFDKVKIDQSFVRDIGKSNDSLAIIRAVAGMCGSMGITSIVEGVETDAQFQVLKGEECDSLQGYLFGRPMPLDEACRLAESIYEAPAVRKAG